MAARCDCKAGKIGVQFAEIEEPVDPVHEMVLRNMPREIELAEQSRMRLLSF